MEDGAWCADVGRRGGGELLMHRRCEYRGFITERALEKG